MRIIFIIIVIVLTIVLIAVFIAQQGSNIKKIAEIVDCGQSSKSLDDFENPFFDVDFDQDDAFSCMGKNIKNECLESKMTIEDSGAVFTYIIKGPECSSRIELEDPERGFIWAECSIAGLISFIKEQAKDVQDFQMMLDKAEQGDGDYGAVVFALTALSPTFNSDDFERLGCKSSNQQ